MRIKLHLFVLSLLTIINISKGLKSFNGRLFNRHGMLGLPGKRSSSLTTGLRDEPDEVIQDQWFEQRLDHFDPTNTKTWKQRYFVSEKYFDKNNGPVFLQLGGEGEADPIWLKEGQIATNYAKEFKALSIMIEHRYYGKSWPTSDLSTKNLKYLTSEQALNDAALFIDFINKKYQLTDKNKWIVFGGSYSGSLAAWFRLKYPHLVAGAVASSAPVQAVLNFKDYIKVVDESLGQHCVQQIRSATDEISKMLQNPKQWELIEEKFHLCDKLDGNNKLDVSNLMSNLANNFEGVVQYNKDNRQFEGARGTNITIDTLCSIMADVDSYPSSTDRLAKINKMMLDTYSLKCLEFKYDDFIDEMRVIDWNKTESGGRQWTYQTCTEFGFYQTSDLRGQPFGNYFPLEFFVRMCQDIYGEKFGKEFIENGIEFTNQNYGGYNMTLTNVIFPNGLIDPWHALGILHPIDSTAVPLIMKTTAHCADMYPDSDIDPPELRKGREIIKTKIAQFLDA